MRTSLGVLAGVELLASVALAVAGLLEWSSLAAQWSIAMLLMLLIVSRE